MIIALRHIELLLLLTVTTHCLTGNGERLVQTLDTRAAAAAHVDTVGPHHAVLVKPHLGGNLTTAHQRVRPVNQTAATARSVSEPLRVSRACDKVHCDCE